MIEFAGMAVTPAPCLQVCYSQQCIDADDRHFEYVQF